MTPTAKGFQRIQKADERIAKIDFVLERLAERQCRAQMRGDDAIAEGIREWTEHLEQEKRRLQVEATETAQHILSHAHLN